MTEPPPPCRGERVCDGSVFFDRLGLFLGRPQTNLEAFEFRTAFDAAVAMEQRAAHRPEMSITALWIDRAQKRASFDVSTAEGVARLATDMPRPRRLHLEVILPSGRTFTAEFAPDPAAFAHEPDADELGEQLRIALTFVVRCFERKVEKAN